MAYSPISPPPSDAMSLINWQLNLATLFTLDRDGDQYWLFRNFQTYAPNDG